MDVSDQPTLRAMAFLYLTLGHATDGALTGDEMRMLGKKLHRWAPEMSLADLGEVLSATVEEYKGIPKRSDKLDRAVRLAAGLASKATPRERADILADLQAIVEADGVVDEREQAFMNELAVTLGVSTR